MEKVVSKMSNKQSFSVCFCFQIKFRLWIAEPPEDIKNLFEIYAENGTMTIDDLQSFLIEFQGESSATKEDAQAVFNSLKHLNIFQRKGLHLDAFFRYLLGDLNPSLDSKVKVYMGEGWHSDFHGTQYDLYSPPDFFVRVGIAGVPRDTKMLATESIEDQWVPVWNKEFTFPLKVPELAVLRVEVNEYDTHGRHDFGGQTCLPIRELRTGIRAVPLHSERGQKYKSVRPLMRFEFDNEE